MKTLRWAAALLALALASPVQAAENPTAHFTIGYDVAATTFVYCRMTGDGDDARANPRRVIIPIKTTGSSTTVSAVTAATNPFADLDVGDTIIVDKSTGQDTVWITAKASDDSVTVSSAVNWSAGFMFHWLKLDCGTDETAGWIHVTPGHSIAMTVQYDAGDLTALEVVWEGKEGSPVSRPVQIYPGPNSDCGFGTLSTNVCSFTVVGDRLTVKVDGSLFSWVRLGLRYNTTDGATREEVHGVLTVAP